MVGVGEHVYGLNLFGAIAALCEKIKVARERFRITRDVYDASRRKCERAGEKRGVAAGARRIFRGFGTGAMHVLCGLIVGGGLAYAWQRTWLKIAGTWGLLGAAITLHAVYNLLIAYGGAAQYAAYALPVLLVAAGRLSAFRLSRRK